MRNWEYNLERSNDRSEVKMYPLDGAGTRRRFIISFEQINMSLVRDDSTRGAYRGKRSEEGVRV